MTILITDLHYKSDPAVGLKLNYGGLICHGLGMYSITARAILERLSENDPSALRAISAQFIEPITPGGELICLSKLPRRSQMISLELLDTPHFNFDWIKTRCASPSGTSDQAEKEEPRPSRLKREMARAASVSAKDARTSSRKLSYLKRILSLRHTAALLFLLPQGQRDSNRTT
jgi:hypothetical protein